jgi:hypothetical protein
MGSAIAQHRRHEAYAYDHDGDNFGGMGKAKMSMVKMGSWINVTCRAAVSTLSLHILPSTLRLLFMVSSQSSGAC